MSDFAVSRGADWLSGLICDRPRPWIALGNLETRYLSDRLAAYPVTQPVYVTALARAGTTILLELLARHAHVATHRYRDFPALFTPYWWDRTLAFTPRRAVDAAERAHGDGMLVTPESPEAMEEVLWSAFFPGLHDPGHSNVLGAATGNERFAAFYRDHLRKLLLVRGRARYVAKGNYNLTRLAYLLHLFPEARFVVPVRGPAAHVASLAKQQALFARALGHNPRARRHLSRVGHHEFGPERAPINAGDDAAVARIQALWDAGEEVTGWAAYWRHLYGFVAARLGNDKTLGDATLVVRYEDLCREPRPTLARIFAHCRLDGAEALIEAAAGELHLPTYYRPDFSPAERATIRRETAEVAAGFGYGEHD